jgi:AcrR family transcriptional regulator
MAPTATPDTARPDTARPDTARPDISKPDAAASHRPVATKGERTRARVLRAAIEHFAAVGFDGSSMPEIARRLGVSHSSLYLHFGRKEQLFRAAVDADLTGLFETVVPALRSGDQHPESIVALIPELVDASRSHPLARRVLAEIDGEQVEALRDLPALVTLERQLTAAVRAGQATAQIRDDVSAATTAGGLISVALALLVVAIRLDDVNDIPRARAALRFLTQTLRPPTA